MAVGQFLAPATQLALEHLGRPLPGAPLPGGFAALTRQVSLESVAAAFTERFTGPAAEGTWPRRKWPSPGPGSTRSRAVSTRKNAEEGMSDVQAD